MNQFWNHLIHTFTNSKTHIANGYSSAPFVWAVFHREMADLDRLLSCEAVESVQPQVGRVPFKRVHQQSRRFALKYLTIYADSCGRVDQEEASTTGKRMKVVEILCSNLAIDVDRSVIVTDAGQVVLTEYGTLWKDIFGTSHDPN